MKGILGFVGAWTVADAIFLMVTPNRWSHWWDRWLVALGSSMWWSRLVGLLELASGAYLLWLSLSPEAARRLADEARERR